MPDPGPARPFPDPYRLLFPLGLGFALAGTLIWPLAALGWRGLAAPIHRALMMQGFETCFVIGFLLTAMPGFTGGRRAEPFETLVAATLMIAVGVAGAAGAYSAAALLFALALIWVAAALGRRILARRAAPPEEFVFVGLGLASGVSGGVWLAGLLGGWWGEPAPSFALRLVSLGMMLSLVLGLGGLLVPAFAGLRDPLVIPGIARPHERRGRRPLYLAVAACLAGAFALEALDRPAAGAAARALAGTVMLVLVWKIAGRGTRRDGYATALRVTGWCLLAGLWLAALVPSRRLAGDHLIYLGGFGLLTMAIATRVVVSHGKHPAELDRRVLGPQVLALLLAATALRIAAEFAGANRVALLGLSGAAWGVAWVWWGLGALPLLARTRDERLVEIARASPAPATE